MGECDHISDSGKMVHALKCADNTMKLLDESERNKIYNNGFFEGYGAALAENPLELIAEAIGQDPRRNVTLSYDNSGWRLLQTFESITDGELITEHQEHYADTDELIKGIKRIYGER
jgi:hypothetical protein